MDSRWSDGVGERQRRVVQAGCRAGTWKVRTRGLWCGQDTSGTFSLCSYLSNGWDHRDLTQAEEELKWGVALSAAADLPFIATCSLPKALACVLSRHLRLVLQPPPSENFLALWVPGCAHTVGQQAPNTTESLHTTAHPCPGTSLPKLAVYLDPRSQSWFHRQVGWVVAEPGYGRRQGNYGVNNRKKKRKRRFLCPCWGRKRRVTVGEGSCFLPADRRNV